MTDPLAPPIGLLIPPDYCDYADGRCDQPLESLSGEAFFFVYPSQPETIAATVQTAIDDLRRRQPGSSWLDWRDLSVAGQIVFCEICKAIRTAPTVIADVTTLNFNLLFEIGYTIGLGVPVIPIRDTNYATDRSAFQELGVLDTLGYVDFTNGTELANKLADRLPGAELGQIPRKRFRESPLYVLKGPVETEGTIRMLSVIKNSALRFRTFDPQETPRLSLNELRRQVQGSFGLIAHLLSENREGSRVHNALCALAAGLATAQGKVVALLQEEPTPQPIDYRDLVQSYTDPRRLEPLLERPIRRVVEQMQSDYAVPLKSDESLLETLDLGDVAAENEIAGLESYFVRTGPYSQARRGHARLVVGRKGTGKSAIFYELRNALSGSYAATVLDLKPEGHQFARLREGVLERMTEGVREYTLVAFWTYILLTELARHVIESEPRWAENDVVRSERFTRLEELYKQHNPGKEADFSERLLANVDRLIAVVPDDKGGDLDPEITQRMFLDYIPELREAVASYLSEKDSVWVLIDNLDKGWPIRGSSATDILITRALLEAVRKIQTQLEGLGVQFTCLVFIRTDIYEHLQRETPDKGKDTAISLDWDDPAVFEEIIRKRVEASTTLAGPLRDIWPQLCASHIATYDSFNYIMERTLMRPRDLLRFLQAAIEVAINRGHTRIHEDDLLQAELGYSEDTLLTTVYEIQDTRPEYADLLYLFDGLSSSLPLEDVEELLKSEVEADRVRDAIELLLWFGFLGVMTPDMDAPWYAYQVQWNMRRLTQLLEMGEAQLVIHPAFRKALDTRTA